MGLEAPKDAQALAEKFGITLDHHNFVKTGSFAPVATSRDGVYVCGAFRSPKAIPRSVTEASAAAAEAARALVEARGTLTREKTYPPERDVSGEEVRIGVFVCSCGINIAGVVDVKDLAEYARSLPGVVAVENNLFTCSTDTQELIAQKIKELNLNRIVVAACTPRTHEPLFQDTLREAGLNPYLLEMANIRNQNSWVHQKEPEAATAKAKDQVRMAVAKVSRDYALERGSVDGGAKGPGGGRRRGRPHRGPGTGGARLSYGAAGKERQAGRQRLEPEQDLERRRGPALSGRPDCPGGKSSPGGPS